MEKTIWIIENNKKDLLDIQRKINALGGIRSMCVFSSAVLKKIIEERLNQGDILSSPSLILINHNMVNADFSILEMLKTHPKLAGTPFFFMVENGEDIDKEEYYVHGAMIVLEKPINQNGLLRIRQAAEQYEMTKSYERIFQKQVSELAAAKEIQRLNVQLESRNKFLRRVFGKYFSDELLEVILESPEGEFVGGDRKNIAVLMSDLRGFSAKSEELHPDELMTLLNYFFGEMVEIIAKYRGTVIEFMGDGILAVFGAPMKNEAFAESAVAAAVCMQNAMQKVNEFCAQRGNPKLEMGIGIHCGETFVGNVGSEKMMRYNVIGRVVNACSRIESCCTGGQIFISENTLKNLSCEVKIESQASIGAKGIREPLQIYEISGIGGEYQCYLEEVEKEALKPIIEEVLFELFSIKNKMISQHPITVVLKELNTQNGIVEIVETMDEDEAFAEAAQQDMLSVFSDVEIKTGENQESIPTFSGVYAKVVSVEGKKIQLRFTHANKELKRFMNYFQLNAE